MVVEAACGIGDAAEDITKMSDPTTSNKLLAIPLRGSDVGTWDVPVNGDFTAIDGMFGGITTIALSAATTILLTVPATGSVSPVAGPNQSQNAVIKFSGTLSGNAVIQFTLPGFYIVHNQCTVGGFFVQLQPAAGTGSGNAVGAPPGRKIHVVYDGTSMDYVNMDDPGTLQDQAVATTPAWMNACTVTPWLICDGTVYNVSSYPQLGAYLGSTFGGNGASTFGVPDMRARYRIPLDNQGTQGAAGRVTAAISGINGTTWGASGGSQNFQAHVHTSTITDPGHSHTVPVGSSAGASGGGLVAANNTIPTGVATTNISVAVNTSGVGASGNIPPGLVFGLTFIKT